MKHDKFHIFFDNIDAQKDSLTSSCQGIGIAPEGDRPS